MAEQTPKILVVDDERFNINVLVDLLKPSYKMLAAKNGKQALKAARSVVSRTGLYVLVSICSTYGSRDCTHLFVSSCGGT
jgi:CheY-like chemotaxis protein